MLPVATSLTIVATPVAMSFTPVASPVAIPVAMPVTPVAMSFTPVASPVAKPWYANRDEELILLLCKKFKPGQTYKDWIDNIQSEYSSNVSRNRIASLLYQYGSYELLMEFDARDG